MAASSLMPNVALNTLLRCGSGGNDSRIVCESLYPTDCLAAAAAGTNDELRDDRILEPSDSFCLSMEDELDWLDLHGHGQVAFFDRSRSTKAAYLNAPTSRSASFSTPQRKKAASAFLVFPKMPDSGELARPSYRRPHRINKSSSRTSFPPIAEPGSPKVTCIGRVRPIREKGPALHRKKSKREPPPSEKKQKAKSLWTPLAAVFRFRRLRKGGQDAGRRSEETPPSGSPAVGAPALGNMMKFAPDGGRRGTERRRSRRSCGVWAGLGGWRARYEVELCITSCNSVALVDQCFVFVVEDSPNMKTLSVHT